jgi:gas vesicle protein
MTEAQSPDEIRREIEQTRQELGTTLEDIEDRVSPARIKERQTDRIKSRFQRARDSVMGTRDSVMGSAQETRSSAAGGLQSVKERAGDTLGDTKETLQQAPEQALQQARGNPMAAGLIAFGGGLLLASLLPTTQREQDAAEALRDRYEEPVKEQLKQVGQEAKSNLQGTAQQAAQEVKSTAQDAAQQTKSSAQSSAESVKGDAQRAREETTSS